MASGDAITGTNDDLTFGGAGNVTVADAIATGTGTLTKDGAGTLILSGNNTYTGTTTVTVGVLNIQHANALGTTANGTTVTSGAALQIQGGITTALKPSPSTAPASARPAPCATFPVTTLMPERSPSTAPTRINSDSGTLTLNVASGNAITGSNDDLTFGGAGNVTVADVIATGTGALTKDGAGTLTLSGANTYTGVTTVSAGTLVIGANAPSGSAGALGNASSEVVLGVAGGNSDASILIGGAFTVGRIIRIPTTNTTDAGTRVLTLGGNTADESTFSGNIFLGTTNQAGRGVTLTAASGGQVTFSGVIQNPSGMDATAYTVTKSGLGTVVLSGANTYTGNTTVTAGTRP